jgi:hypothetical protein
MLLTVRLLETSFVLSVGKDFYVSGIVGKERSSSDFLAIFLFIRFVFSGLLLPFIAMLWFYSNLLFLLLV